MSAQRNRDTYFLHDDTLAFRRVEDAYMAMRARGVESAEAAADLGLKPSTRYWFEKFYNFQREDAPVDGSPQFARDEEHVEAVLAAGGFPRRRCFRDRAGNLITAQFGPDGQPWRVAA